MRAKILPAIVTSLVIALFACTGCSQQGPVGGPDAPSSSSGTVSLDNQGAMNVFLDYNAGTGFEWQCSLQPEGVLSILSQRAEDQSGEPATTGGPLRDTVALMAVAPGTATLTCELVRPWEEDAGPAEVQTFVFTVDDDLQITFDEAASDFKNPPEEFFFS